MLVATLVAAQPIPSTAPPAAHPPCPASRGSTAAPASATAAPAALTALATSTITTTTLATISIATRPFAASQPPPPEGLGLASVRVPHLGIARGRGSLEAQILLAPGPIYLPDCLLDADQ